MHDLEAQKILEELKELRKPWYQRPEQWAAYTAVIASLAGLGFQYSLHDQTLLIAKNEKSLAQQEKIKAENDKFLVIRERIQIGEKLVDLKTQLKSLIEAHNKRLAAIATPTPEVQSIISANIQFLSQLDSQTKVALAQSPPSTSTQYFSWVDSLLSTLFGLGAFIVAVIFIYSYLSRKQPDLFPTVISALKSSTKKP